MAAVGRGRGVGLGLLASGVVCPCHVLIGAVSLLTGGALLSPAAQDGLHAVYVPLAVLAGAVLLGKRPTELPAGERALRRSSH